ncbi:MAG TPA: prepilin-type N-terminal cleavage/methylation domain-containing protein [Thermococcus sp.]|nr:prepilin-type N-terminal cleavage/methylation domain-containing protein [Thermococcus sp.]
MLSKVKRNNEKGFTLIELMIVIAIIGILAAIAIPQFSAYRTRSYNSAAQADLRNAATAQEAFYVDNQRYCQTISLLAGATYGFYTSENVTVTILAADQDSYSMQARHSSGDTTYTLAGPGGSIQ